MKMKQKIMILAAAFMLPSCATWEKYGSEVEDMADRVEVGIGFAVKSGYIYGPLRGRLRPSEQVHPVAESTTPKLYEIESSK